MRWEAGQDVPKPGEWLRRRDNGKFARVHHIASLGVENPRTCAPLYEGDVIMRYGPGRDCVTSGGPYFWSKWERVDVERAAEVALREAQR